MTKAIYIVFAISFPESLLGKLGHCGALTGGAGAQRVNVICTHTPQSLSKAKQSRAEQSRAEQSRAKESKAAAKASVFVVYAATLMQKTAYLGTADMNPCIGSCY